MNYSELKDQVIVTAMRSGDDEFEAAVPGFFRLTEARMNRQLRTRQMEASEVLAFTDGSAALPADYLQYRSLVFEGNPARVVQAVSPDVGVSMFPYGVGGTPGYFSVTGDVLVTYPKYEGDLRLNYYREIPALTEAAPSNWVSSRHPELYLYGAMIEASSFMMDDQRVATWGTKYDLAMRSIIGDDEMSKYANVASRVAGPTP